MSQRCFLNSLPILLALLLGFCTLPTQAAGTATCTVCGICVVRS